jgi:hypothetical protein
MAIGIYSDPAGTTPVAAELPAPQTLVDPAPLDRVLYVGSKAQGAYLLAQGGGDIIISITGPGASNVAIAASAAGLATAIPGASLVLGETVTGLVPVHVRVLDTTHVVGDRLATLASNTVEEWQLP